VLTSECCEVDFVLKVMFIWLLVHPTVTSECCEVECCLVVAVLVRFRVLLLSGCLVLAVVLLSSLAFGDGVSMEISVRNLPTQNHQKHLDCFLKPGTSGLVFCIY
jgi:hypothetical protein